MRGSIRAASMQALALPHSMEVVRQADSMADGRRVDLTTPDARRAEPTTVDGRGSTAIPTRAQQVDSTARRGRRAEPTTADGSDSTAIPLRADTRRSTAAARPPRIARTRRQTIAAATRARPAVWVARTMEALSAHTRLHAASKDLQWAVLRHSAVSEDPRREASRLRARVVVVADSTADPPAVDGPSAEAAATAEVAATPADGTDLTRGVAASICGSRSPGVRFGSVETGRVGR